MAGELGRRLIVAGFGIPFGIFVIYLGGWPLGIVLALVAAGASYEFYELASKLGARPLYALGIPASAGLVLVTTSRPSFELVAPLGWAVTVALVLVALAAAVWLRGPSGAPLGSASATVIGALAAGGTLSFAVLVRHLPETGTAGGIVGPWAGALLLIFPLLVTWFGDTCAYFAGKRWGKRKLIPSVSPGKTVVGSVAGLAGSAAVAALFAYLALGGVPVYAVSVVAAVGMGFAIGVVAQVGDLAESVLKREAGVKDSGSLLPGHGGVLDRFDAVFYTVPVAYLLILLNGLYL